MSDLAKRIREAVFDIKSLDVPLLLTWADEIDAMQDERRDRFAGQIMAGMLSDVDSRASIDRVAIDIGEATATTAARLTLEYTDALIAELDKGEG